MLVLVPLIFFFMVFSAVNGYLNVGRRIALLVSAILTGTVIAFLTEILSLFHSFSFYPLAGSWFVAMIISIGVAWPVLKTSLRTIPLDTGTFCLDEKFLLFFIELIVVITGITAIASTPNTWDSMTYHLARVEHWIQDRSVAYYPTHMLRQLYFCPWAEYALAHLRLLCPWEPVVNLLQWSAMLGSLVGVSLIAKQLGASRRGQLAACLVAGSLPMGILQSVSTQTDYVETFWLLSFIFFIQELRRNFRLLFLLSAGLSLGLALLTKGYGYILMVPFLIYSIFSVAGLFKKVRMIGVVVICVIVLNTGYYVRNQLAFGSLTVAKDDHLVTSSLDLKVLTGNLLRNFAVEIDTPFQRFNFDLPLHFAHFSRCFGVDFFYDPKASNNQFYPQDFRISESYSGDFIHMILFLSAVFVCCLMRRKSKGLGLYVFCICCAGVLFCWVIRYQHWLTRFHLPMFIMFCPVMGVLMDRILSPLKLILLGLLFFLNAYFFLFFNSCHPWFGPANIWQYSNKDRYFISRPNIIHTYFDTAQQIKNLTCRQIGIVSGLDSWEYPLWSLFKEQDIGSFRIEHVFVKNQSAHLPYPLGYFDPCVIITIEDDPPVKVAKYKNYKKIWTSQDPNRFRISMDVPFH